MRSTFGRVALAMVLALGGQFVTQPLRPPGGGVASVASDSPARRRYPGSAGPRPLYSPSRQVGSRLTPNGGFGGQERRRGAIEESGNVVRVRGVAAKEPMVTEGPEVAGVT